MLKRIYLMLLVLLGSIMTVWAEEVTYSPTQDVSFRTKDSGNTAWKDGFPKDAAVEGNNDFEMSYANGLFSLQKYTIANLQNATKLVLTLTVGSKAGVDAIKVWPFTKNGWTAATGIDDIVPEVTSTVGVAPYATEGTVNSELAKGVKVSGSNPAKATFTITGAALATIKANAASDGTFTLLLTNYNVTDVSKKRSYLSNNTANDEANCPTLVATIETPKVVNSTTGVGYSSMNDAFAALTGDADLVINDDITLTDRCTLNQAYTVSITASKDVTIKGPKNKMWFLVNVNNATLKIGSADHKITLDGISDDRSGSSNVDVTRRENNTQLYLTNIEFKDFTCGANHLVGCKNAAGAIYLEDITFTNCSSADALISNLREANDALLLKGHLNVENCTGTTIFTAKNRIRLGDPDGSSIYQDFSASNVITIGWGGEFAEGTLVVIKVPASAKDMFQLVSDEWYLERKASNGDMYMTKPADPTVKIGTTGYADLAAALAAVQDGETISLLADQEVSSRINVKNMSITIDGQSQYAIKRAASYTNGLLFVTLKADEGYTSQLTLNNIVLDGQSVETSAAFIEAGNSGTTILNGVTLKNITTTADAAVINKAAGMLTLNGVTFTNCITASAMVFVGTNKVTLKGENTIPNIYLAGTNVLNADNATATSPITLTTETSSYGRLVAGGTASQYTSSSFRLVQMDLDVYGLPQIGSGSYTHPGLLHTSADIARVKASLNVEPFASAYNRLEYQSAGSAAGAVEYLKRMDKSNWESVYPDYSNYTRAATDAKLAYELALRYQLKGSTAAADAAVSILKDWATNCKGIFKLTNKVGKEGTYVNSIPDSNEYLMCIQAYQFANAAELLRDYMNSSDFATFKEWMRTTFADVAILFLENHHGQSDIHYWLNWDLAAVSAMLSVGVLCDDATLVDYALAYPTSGVGTGNVAKAIVDTHADPDSNETLTQCQESGRDQAHATLDISLLGAR